MAKWLIVAGAVLMGTGVLILGLEKLGLPFGRLPGDLSYRGRGFSVFAPLGTSLLLSLLLSLVLYALSRFRQ